MNRRKLRESVFKLLFSEPFFEKSEYLIMIDRMSNNSDCIADEKDRLSVRESVLKVIDKLEIIDSKISDNTRSWSIDRINKTLLAILRVGIYEILFDDEVPNKVAINEAVELSKSYADEDSFSFVNALLAKVLNE